MLSIKTLTKISLIYITLVLLAALGVSLLGCGSSENPVAEDLKPSETKENKPLKVEIEVANQTVKAGEQVRLTAKTSAPTGTKILYSWKVVDGEGILDNADASTVIWTAPNSVRSGEVKIGVVQVTVTLISQQFSGNGDNTLKVSKEIQSVTKTVPITVVG